MSHETPPYLYFTMPEYVLLRSDVIVMSHHCPQAQMLAEMDREFGVGELVSETFQEEKRQVYNFTIVR